jgi:hypothetical protein
VNKLKAVTALNGQSLQADLIKMFHCHITTLNGRARCQYHKGRGNVSKAGFNRHRADHHVGWLLNAEI